jgi:hypothetical protein
MKQQRLGMTKLEDFLAQAPTPAVNGTFTLTAVKEFGFHVGGQGVLKLWPGTYTAKAAGKTYFNNGHMVILDSPNGRAKNLTAVG